VAQNKFQIRRYRHETEESKLLAFDGYLLERMRNDDATGRIRRGQALKRNAI
jgi:hypothetical protein